MADDRISIILEAVDQASGPLQGLASNIADMAGRGAGAIGGVSTALAGVGVIAGGAALAGVLALGKAGVDAWGEMDTAADTLMQKTGASGEALDEMTQSVMNLRASAAGLDVDTQTIADTMAVLSQRTGATGEYLDALTGQTLEFSKIMGGDAAANAEAFSRVLAGFNVPAEEGAGAMDKIFVAAQKFGISGQELLSTLDRFGPTLRQMGLGVEESAVLIGSMSKAGLDADGALGAVTKSAAKFAKEGISIQDGLSGAITAIQGAKTDTEALAIASETFGGKAAVKMVDGIRSGKISLEELTGGLGDTQNALNLATDAALDAPDKWKMGMTQIQNALVPVGEAVMGLAAEIMPMVSEVITSTVVPALQTLGVWLKDHVPGAVVTLKSVWESLQPALATVMAFVTGTVIPALQTFGGWLRDNLPGAIATLVSFWNTSLYPALQTVGVWLQGTLFPILATWAVWLRDNLPPAIATLVSFWQTTLWPALQTVGAWVQGTLFPILAEFGNWLATNLPTAIGVLVNIWQTVLQPALSALWAFVQDPLTPILKVLAQIVGEVLKLAFEALAGVWQNVLKPALDTLWSLIQTYVVPQLQAFSDKLGGLQGVLDTVGGWIRGVTDRLNAFRDTLSSIELPDFLQRHSPSPIEQTFMGLASVTPQATQTLQAFGAAAGALDAASLNVAAVQSLADAMLMLVQIMGDPRMGVVEPGSNDAARIQGMSDALGRVASAIKNVVDTIDLISGKVGTAALARIRDGRDALEEAFALILDLGRAVATQAGLAQERYSAETIAALQSLGDVLQRTNSVMTTTVSIVQAFLDKVNNAAILGALGSAAARAWIVDLVQLIVTWGDQIAAAAAQVELTADTRATPGLAKLGSLLAEIKGVYETTVGAVITFLDDVNNPRFLAALGSAEARAWIVDLTALIVEWGNQIGDAVDDVQITINGEVTPKLAALASLLNAATGALTSTIEAIETLLDITKTGPPSIDAEGAAQLVIRPLVAIGQGLAREIGLAMGAWSQVPPQSAALSKIVQEGVGVLTTTVEAVQTLIDLGKTGFPTIDPQGAGELIIKPLILTAKGLAKAIQDNIGDWKAAALPLKELADTVDGIVGVVDAVVASLTRLAQPDIEFLFYGTPEQTAEKILLLNGHMIDVIALVAERLADRIKAAVGTWKPSDVPTQALGDMVSGIVGVIDAVVESLTRLAQPDIEFLFYGTPQETAAKIILLNGHMIDVIVAVAQALAKRIKDAMGAWKPSEIPVSALSGLISDFGSLLNNVMDIFTAIMQATKDKVPWNDAEAQAVAENSVGVIIAFALRLAKAAETALKNVKVAAIPALEKLGAVIGELGGLLGDVFSILGLFVTGDDAVDYSVEAQRRVNEALVGLIAFAVWMADRVNAVLDLYQAQKLVINKGLEKVRDTVAAAADMLGNVFDILALVAPGDDAVDYSEAAQRRVNEALVGLVAFASWMADRVNSVLDLYQAQTLVVNKGLEKVKDTIASTADILGNVFDVLQMFAPGEDAIDYSEAAQRRVNEALVGLIAFASWMANRVNAVLDLYEAQTIVVNKGLEKVKDTLNSTLSIVKDTLDIAKLTDKVGAFDPARMGVLRDKLLAALPFLVQIATDFAQQASAPQITEAWGKAAQTLADVVGNAVGAMRDALDLGGLLSDRDTVIPGKQQMADKVAAILDVVDVAVTAFSTRASAAATSGLDTEGLAGYAGAVQGVFGAITEVANAVKSFTGITTSTGFATSGFNNIRAALQQIWDLFDDASKHSALVASVTSTLTVALDGVTSLAGAKGAAAGNAWLAGFQGAVGGAALATASGPGQQQAPQVVNNYVTNNTKSMTANINASTSEAGKGAVMGAFSMVMY